VSAALFDAAGGYLPVPARTCLRCGHVLVGVDELGPYYQVPVGMPMPELLPGFPSHLTFMDRVHACGGLPHALPAADGTCAGPATIRSEFQTEGCTRCAAMTRHRCQDCRSPLCGRCTAYPHPVWIPPGEREQET
jgi:hypothetical protein